MRGYAKGNLVFVLLVTQTVQVLLLSLAVFAFFMLFGSLVMSGNVVDAWQTDAPFLPSCALVQVSTFLAAFSGLYFAVYAVTDETYRREFFTEVLGELERAVACASATSATRDPPDRSPSSGGPPTSAGREVAPPPLARVSGPDTPMGGAPATVPAYGTWLDHRPSGTDRLRRRGPARRARRSRRRRPGRRRPPPRCHRCRRRGS